MGATLDLWRDIRATADQMSKEEAAVVADEAPTATPLYIAAKLRLSTPPEQVTQATQAPPLTNQREPARYVRGRVSSFITSAPDGRGQHVVVLNLADTAHFRVGARVWACPEGGACRSGEARVTAADYESGTIDLYPPILALAVNDDLVTE